MKTNDFRVPKADAAKSVLKIVVKDVLWNDFTLLYQVTGYR